MAMHPLNVIVIVLGANTLGVRNLTHASATLGRWSDRQLILWCTGWCQQSISIIYSRAVPVHGRVVQQSGVVLPNIRFVGENVAQMSNKQLETFPSSAKYIGSPNTYVARICEQERLSKQADAHVRRQVSPADGNFLLRGVDQ